MTPPQWRTWRALGVSYPVSGVLNANIAAQGTQLTPAGRGSISLARTNIAGQPVQALNVNFQGTGQAVNAALQIRTP
ncbi:MAG: hypothetical protein ACE14L_02675 [Terriglobales bacterium]